MHDEYTSNKLYRRYSDDNEDEEEETDQEIDMNPLIPTTTTSRIFRSSRIKARKIQRAVFFVCTILIFLLLLYIPLFNNVRQRVIAIPGWNFNTSRVVSDYILPFENTTLIEPPTLCDDPQHPNKNLFLLIVVCSSAANFDARQTIRETWGNNSEFNYPYFEKFHSALSGRYLTPNYKYWKNYSVPVLLEKANESKLIPTSHQYVNGSRFLIKVLFLLGEVSKSDISTDLQTNINYESDMNGDIIQESFLDSYNNLTLKSILMLKWVKNNCMTKVKFVMKCDDDSFINVPNLVHVLLGGTVPVYKSTISFHDRGSINAVSFRNRLSENSQLLMGYMFCDAKPIADVTSKWYSPNYMYNGDFYPNYLSGTAYLLGIDAVRKLFDESLRTPLFHLEDVYITGICASRIKLKRHHHPLFFYSYSKDKCALRGMLTQHQMTPTDIQLAYNFITNLSISCGAPERNFVSTKLKLTQRKRCK